MVLYRWHYNVTYCLISLVDIMHSIHKQNTIVKKILR